MRPIRLIQAALALCVCAPAWAGAQAQASRLIGQLVAGDGAPVIGAEITIADTLLAARSDSSGRFVLEALSAGQVRVQARAVGYSPLDTTLTLQPGETRAVTLRMSRTVQQLAPVVTEAVLPYGKPLRYQHTGRFDDFYERRAKRPGTFFTREDIENSGRNSAMELLSSVPGITMNWRNGSAVVRVARCTATSIFGGPRDRGDTSHPWFALYIDGQRVGKLTNAIEILAHLKAIEIETMEVYRGVSQLPIQAMGDACAAVFVTTRYTTGSVLTNK